MLSLQILAAATCPTGQTAAPSSISCVWSTERTPSAFDCPALCAADGGVPACPADANESAWLASALADSACSDPACSWASFFWLGVYRPPNQNLSSSIEPGSGAVELAVDESYSYYGSYSYGSYYGDAPPEIPRKANQWNRCMDGSVANVDYWMDAYVPQGPDNLFGFHCGFLLGGDPGSRKPAWLWDAEPGELYPYFCDILAFDNAWPLPTPRNSNKYPCACMSGVAESAAFADDAAIIIEQRDQAFSVLRGLQQAMTGTMFGVAIVVWLVLSVLLGVTDPNMRRAVRQVMCGGKKAPPDSPATKERKGSVFGSVIAAAVEKEKEKKGTKLSSTKKLMSTISSKVKKRRAMSQEEIMAKLTASLDAAAFVRVRVSFALRSVGILLITIGFTPFLTGLATAPNFTNAVAGPFLLYMTFAPIGLTLCCIAVMPSDVRAVRVVQIVALVVMAVVVTVA